MKDLPHYKVIEIKGWEDFKNPKIVREFDNTKNPVVINLEKLSPIPQEKIFSLEEIILAQVPSINYPYPVYILGHSPNYFGQLSFFYHKNHLPKFYSFKSKATTKIHSELLHYNQIAQREYECINFKKAEEIKYKYSDIQKKIYYADCELRALNQICSIIKKNQNERAKE